MARKLHEVAEIWMREDPSFLINFEAAFAPLGMPRLAYPAKAPQPFFGRTVAGFLQRLDVARACP
jgi:hypothetical protein